MSALLKRKYWTLFSSFLTYNKSTTDYFLSKELVISPLRGYRKVSKILRENEIFNSLLFIHRRWIIIYDFFNNGLSPIFNYHSFISLARFILDLIKEIVNDSTRWSNQEKRKKEMKVNYLAVFWNAFTL